MLPYFRRIETSKDAESQVRGATGPLSVSPLPYIHELTPRFIAAAGEVGLPFNPDIYGERQDGVGYVQSSARNGRRHDSFTAFLKPAIARGAAVMLQGARARRVIFEHGRATGVEFEQDGVVRTIVARTLQIAPRVTIDGVVSSHIFCVVSSVTGYLQGYPTISQREAETYASVRDGESFVIGGLTQDSSLKSKSKLPLLGDIPILGALFGVNKISNQKTELCIMVTPHIIRRLDPAVLGSGRDQVPPGSLVPSRP